MDNFIILSLAPNNGSYRDSTLDTLSDQLKELANLPEKATWLHKGSVKLALPDGFGFLQDALCLLKKHEMPYTIFYSGSDFVYSSHQPQN